MANTTWPAANVSPVRCRSAAGSAPGGSTSCSNSMAPEVALRPINLCSGPPFTNSSAITKISFLDWSITGVPVIPTVGEISPQGSDDAGTAGPTWVDQTTAPVEEDSAYTTSSSVAT